MMFFCTFFSNGLIIHSFGLLFVILLEIYLSSFLLAFISWWITMYDVNTECYVNLVFFSFLP